MALVTQQDLIDAAVDAQALEDYVNGAADRSNPGQANGTVTTRLGRVLKTLAKLQAEIDARATGDVATQGYVDAHVAKAWGLIRIDSAGVATLMNGFNVATCSWTGAVLTINFTTDMPDALYALTCSAEVTATCKVTPDWAGNSAHAARLIKSDAAGVSNFSTPGDMVAFAVYR